MRENSLFLNFLKFRSVEFFKNLHFPFQVPKAITKKNHGVTELVFKLFEP